MPIRFQYLLDRIVEAEFDEDPFPHLCLEDFLTESDFKEITTSQEIDLAPANDLDDLFASLKAADYEPIQFPGCTQLISEYRRGIETASKPGETHAACEGQGMALRLQRPVSEAVIELDAFFRSTELKNVLSTKFGLTAPTRLEAGLQKYLHGYEISPHPDIRSKALTWMFNVNPSADSESFDFHTPYLKFKPEYAFISSLWQNNASIETCWVPWDWCETVKRQPENNSIVIFAPRYDTMHAIRAHYDHLATQRTQFYGNFWYEDSSSVTHRPQFADYDFTSKEFLQDRPPLRIAKRAMLAWQKVKSRL